MQNRYYLDIDCEQINHFGELICGDVFLMRRVKEEGRTIVVLSDGMGSGVKANVLATLTATMAMNFTVDHRDVQQSAEIIMNTLPVCSERNMSYSTFVIIDIEENGQTTIIEYDVPHTLLLRGNRVQNMDWQTITLKEEPNSGKLLYRFSFQAQTEDRIVFWSDGVLQSGLGTKAHPLGWERDDLEEYVQHTIKEQLQISSLKLARRVVNMAELRDEGKCKDDTSCGIIYFREPRNLIVVSGPPFKQKDDSYMAQQLHDFSGRKVIAGGSTAELISRELNIPIHSKENSVKSELPPLFQIDGVDLVTEGILTLSKVASLLEKFNKEHPFTQDPAEQMIKLFFESDDIYFLVGTKINEEHQNPLFSFDLEIRKTVIQRIVKLLENRYLKSVRVSYL